MTTDFPPDPLAEDETPPAPRAAGVEWMRSARGRRLLRWIGAAAALISLVSWWNLSGRERTDDAMVEGSVHPVSARVEGSVIRVAVEDNQYVEQGEVLFEIEPIRYEVRLQRAKADLAEAVAIARAASTDVPISSTSTESELTSARTWAEDAEAGVLLSERVVEAAGARLLATRADVRRAEAEHERARKDLERFRPLVEKDEISRQTWDAAVEHQHAKAAGLDSAEARVVAAGNEVEIAEKRLTQARAALRRSRAEVENASTGPQQVLATEARAASAKARVDQARAALRQAELELEYTRVKAPASGVVTRKNVENGQFVGRGQAVLAVVDLDHVWVVARFKETQLEAIKTGQRASIRVDAYSGSFSGRVDSIAAATSARFSLLPPQNSTRNFVKVVQRVPVKIVLDESADPERVLRPGMSVIARVETR